MKILTYDERVEFGAAWLDEVEPGWIDRLDLATLQLSDVSCCVIGQLDRARGVQDFDWARGVQGFMLEDSLWTRLGFRIDQLDYGNALRFGFWLLEGVDYLDVGTHYSDEYAELTDAWRRCVARRRLNAVEATERIDDTLVAVNHGFDVRLYRRNSQPTHATQAELDAEIGALEAAWIAAIAERRQ